MNPKPSTLNPKLGSYVEAYGQGEFDGYGSGHDFYGTLFMPPTGSVNNCDGKRV
jgi:hypothetical protein